MTHRVPTASIDDAFTVRQTLKVIVFTLRRPSSGQKFREAIYVSNAPDACNEVEARGGCVRLWNAAVVVVNGELDGCPYEGLI